jgi:hypothetical protein
MMASRERPVLSRGSIALFAVIAAAVFPASAFAQATRTWVSGVGDDANPCSRTAPCKTFAGAISKTQAGGEINVLDPGGFGAVTITKSITIAATGVIAGVLVSGTNAIVISAGPNDRVTLRGLDIDGLGTGLEGVNVLSAGVVRVEDSKIYGFSQDGINVQPSSATTKVVVERTQIHDNNRYGVFDRPSGAGSVGRVTLRSDSVDDNNNSGIAATDSGGGRAIVNSFRTGVADNSAKGIYSSGSLATVTISANEITGNNVGLYATLGGSILSFSNNLVTDNTTNGAPTGHVSLTAKDHSG